jgi:hypothetical protein
MVMTACSPPSATSQAPSFDTPYQAVFLQSGQAFLGKLEGLGSDYPVLRDVHQIQQQMNPDTKEVIGVVIKRSASEPHAPDRMVLNARQISFIEPVGVNSRVAGLLTGANPSPTAQK